MKKRLSVTCQLGELIYELYEAAKTVSSEPAEQKLLVYAALNDLVGKQGRKQTTKAA